MANRRFFWSRETQAEVAITAGPVSLADRIASGPLPLEDVLHYAIALAESLREVHHRSRVYACLNPSSVTVLAGQVRLAPCSPSQVSPYFSPEQIAGRDLDLRTDIFSLGAVTYEMLSGRKPFEATTRTGLRMEILDREPAPLENLPPTLSRLVTRCLEKRPERRVQRMEILLATLKLQAIMTRQLS